MRVLVAGSSGFLGSHVVDVLRAQGHDVIAPQRTRDALQSFAGTTAMLYTASAARPIDVVVHVAGLSGGLGMCKAWGERMYTENLSGKHVIDALLALPTSARPALVTIGHMCMYAAEASQPYREVDLLSGELDPVTKWYGQAKRDVYAHMLAARERGLRAVCVVPTNLYGPRDAFADPLRSHAAGAMIERYTLAARERAPSVTNWGTGSAVRDFLFVEDAARGVVAAAERVQTLHDAGVTAINLAGPAEVSIRELAEACARATNYTGQTLWDTAKPNGVPRRVLDATPAQAVLGWKAQVDISQGVARTTTWLRERERV
jgi:GDP-L-fucose synthase